jgi:hypothetical protein
MKKKCFFLLVGLILFISCKEYRKEETIAYQTNFYFQSPQPVDDSELNNFPVKYRGAYIEGEDTMYVDKKAIYYTIYRLDTITKIEFDSLKSIAEYKDEKLIFKLNDYIQEYTVKDKGNLLYLSSKHNDTVFALSPDHKAKRINGDLVLSYKDSIFWRSSMLSIQKDSLVWKYLSTPDDYLKIKPFVKDISIDKDTTLVHLKPTRKEFKKLLGLKTSQRSYKKIK